MEQSRAQPELFLSQRSIWAGLALVAVALISACNSGNGGEEQAAAVLPPASSLPTGLDDTLKLPADVEPVAFNYTEVELIGVNLRTLTVATAAVPLSRATLGMLVADTFDRRTRGLMYREALPPHTGMLFAFPVETTTPFWNKDTPMSLDIAFLDADGVVLEILRLEPLDPTLVAPEEFYLFAVELPGGWFAQHEFGVGSRFLVPESVEGLAE